jgi:hypothetical protein
MSPAGGSIRSAQVRWDEDFEHGVDGGTGDSPWLLPHTLPESRTKGIAVLLKARSKGTLTVPDSMLAILTPQTVVAPEAITDRSDTWVPRQRAIDSCTA